ncbi:MAG: TetR/AcrR family transcriptional regulator [Pseudomonadota bacterium]
MALLAEKRGKIIDAAVAEFRERGFAGASMDRVATRAEVSKRTVYNHFESKEALFRAILDLMAESCNAAFAVTYVPGTPIEDQIRGLGWAEGKLLTSPDFMKLARMVMGETMRDPELAAEMNCKLERIAAFQEFMEAAAADGALAIDDPARAADQFLGLIKSQAFWPAIHSGEIVSEAEMERIVETTTELFLSFYKPKC